MKEEKNLKVSEAKYKTIFDSVNDAIFIHDPDTGEILEVNRKMTEMFGYSAHEARKLTIGDISSGIPPYNQKGAIERVRASVKSGELIFEWHCKDKFGHLFWIEVSLRPVVIEGNPFIVATVRDIPKRKRAEENLKESESRYHSLFENNHLIILLIRPATGRIIDANPAAVTFYGYSREQLTSMNITEINTLTREQVAQKIKMALSLQQRMFNFRHRLAGGEVRDVEVYSGPIVVSGETLLYSIVHDITERKLAEEELKRTTDRFRVLTQNLSVGVALIDGNGRFSIVNPAFLRMFELSEDSNIMNVNDQEWAKWQVVEENGKLLDVDEYPVRKAAMTGKAVRNRLVGVRGPSGSETRWMLISAEPIFKQDGGLDVTICTYQDITVRKKAEEALKEERARLAATLESMPDEVWFADKSMRVTLVNRAVEKDFDENVDTGQQVEEIAARYEVYRADGTHRPPEEFPPLRALHGEIVRDQEEMVRIPATGEFRNRLISASPVTDSQGDIIGSVSVVRDITEQKRVEGDLHTYRQNLESLVQERTAELGMKNERLKEEMAEREKAEARLAQTQKMEAIGTLAGGIAHDLKNILTPILINTEMALEDVGSDHPAYPVLQEALDAAKLGRDLVQQILTFSRRAPKKKVLVNIPAVIKETMGFLRSTLPSTIDVRNELKDECIMACADPTQIKQVLINLGTNAGQAMREQGGVLEVSESMTDLDEEEASQISPDLSAGPYILVSVRDTGEGMDEETMQHIFEPFFTTKKGEGTGMGLAVAHGIVKEHQGAIRVRSAPGEGSLFTVLLPVMENCIEDEKRSSPQT